MSGTKTAVSAPMTPRPAAAGAGRAPPLARRPAPPGAGVGGAAPRADVPDPLRAARAQPLAAHRSAGGERPADHGRVEAAGARGDPQLVALAEQHQDPARLPQRAA